MNARMFLHLVLLLAMPAMAQTAKPQLDINNPDDVMAMPYALVANRQRFNIYSGNY